MLLLELLNAAEQKTDELHQKLDVAQAEFDEAIEEIDRLRAAFAALDVLRKAELNVVTASITLEDLGCKIIDNDLESE